MLQADVILILMFITNRFLIDAKSILGVLSLDLTRELTVDCHGESREFDRTLKKFAVA